MEEQQPQPVIIQQNVKEEEEENDLGSYMSSHLKPILIGFLVVFVLASIAIYAIIRLTGNTISPKTQNVSVSPFPTPAEVKALDTSNWKTYLNEKNEYLIQYPSDKFVRIDCSDEELLLYTRQSEKEDVIFQKACGRDALYTLEIQTFSTIPKEPISDTFFTVKKETIEIAGIPSHKYISTPTLKAKEDEYLSAVGGAGETILIFVPYKNKTIRIYSYMDFQTLEQILSTFKFTDAITPTQSSSQGKACGGSAGALCPIGYKCKTEGSSSDASGVCERVNDPINTN